MTRADPSRRKCTEPHLSAAASERLSSASRMTEAMAMSTSPRRRALFADSVRPVGPERGRWAVRMMAASPSAVRPRAWRGSLRPSSAARLRSPAKVWRTPSPAVGVGRPAARWWWLIAFRSMARVDIERPSAARWTRYAATVSGSAGSDSSPSAPAQAQNRFQAPA